MAVRIYGMDGRTLGTIDLVPGVSVLDLVRRQRRFELFFATEQDATPAAPEPAGGAGVLEVPADVPTPAAVQLHAPAPRGRRGRGAS